MQKYRNTREFIERPDYETLIRKLRNKDGQKDKFFQLVDETLYTMEKKKVFPCMQYQIAIKTDHQKTSIHGLKFCKEFTKKNAIHLEIVIFIARHICKTCDSELEAVGVKEHELIEKPAKNTNAMHKVVNFFRKLKVSHKSAGVNAIQE
jgi:hypothetical protein